MKNLSLKISSKFSFLFLLVFCYSTSIFASRYMASDFGWTKVGQDSFLVTLVIYKDCNGGAMGPVKIKFQCTSTNTIFDSLVIGTPVGTDVTPIHCNTPSRCQNPNSTFPYGVQKYIYQGIIYLNKAGSCCNIKMFFRDSYRNTAITTIAARSFFYTEAIFNRCLSPSDNSPTFTTAPVDIICIGADYTYIPGLTDIDTTSSGNALDSFTYEWTTPLEDSNLNVIFFGSYAYNKPVYFWGFPNADLPFPRGVHLNDATGVIDFRPMKNEVTVLACKVKEYRNNILIGMVRRDIQLITISCPNNMAPYISSANNIDTSITVGDTIKYDFKTDDFNNDSVTISWNQTLPGAVWSDSNGMSKQPSASLTWTPTFSQVSTIPYTFVVTAMDNSCTNPRSNSKTFHITVNPGNIDPGPDNIDEAFKMNLKNYILYPNPASGILNIIYQGKELNRELYLLNSIGQMITRLTLIPGEKAEIDISNLPNGLYLIRDMKGGSINKFIVNH